MPSQNEIIDQFTAAMAAAGVRCNDNIKADTLEIVRFTVDGDRPKSNNGWYTLHTDGVPAGEFGCWKRGIQGTWCAKSGKSLTSDERKQLEARREKTRIEREQAEKQRHAAAADHAGIIWDAAEECTSHPYLVRKSVESFGLRVGRWTKSNSDTGEIWLDVPDALLIPIREGKKIVSMQAIFHEKNSKTGRDKDFLSGGKKRGCFFTIGKPETPESTIVICEGYATGASIHAATGHAVVVAFDAGNLASVAEKIAKKHPHALLVIAADNDRWTTEPIENPGVHFAKIAAKAVDACVVIPEFDFLESKPTDFNDLHNLQGIGAVSDFFSPSALIPYKDQPAPIPEHNEGYFDALIGDIKPEREILLFKQNPVDISQKFLDWLPAKSRLVFWRDEFYQWHKCQYVCLEPVFLHKQLLDFMAESKTIKLGKKDEPDTVVPFIATRSIVEEVMFHLRAGAAKNIEDAPAWIINKQQDWPAEEFIAFQNGYLHYPSMSFHHSSSRLFTISALPFDYDENTERPESWIEFLDSVWGDDQQSINCLAEMFGYMLTADTSQQKAFMLIGPPRCGKGTILRVLEALVGQQNRASPSLASLGTNFGLQPLIGKRATLISDARLSGKADQQPIIENILRITGEDSVTIDRKNLAAWTGKIKARFVLVSNELPPLTDSSAALANRFVMFKFEKSFLGNEDKSLTSRLMRELPAIMKWALTGLASLRSRGYFITPDSAKEQLRDMVDQGSPIKNFVDDCCTLGDVYSVSTDDIYKAWKNWCDDQGIQHYGDKRGFGRRLHAACPNVHKRRDRVGGLLSTSYVGITCNSLFQKNTNQIY